MVSDAELTLLYKRFREDRRIHAERLHWELRATLVINPAASRSLVRRAAKGSSSGLCRTLICNRNTAFTSIESLAAESAEQYFFHWPGAVNR